MKKVTSFTHHVTAEGDRISYTYSEIDDNGKLLNQNVRQNFIVVDEELKGHVDAVNAYIKARLEGQDGIS